MPERVVFATWARVQNTATRNVDDQLLPLLRRATAPEALLGYEPHTQLILANDAGVPRHFLNGRAVQAGAALELLLDEGGDLLFYDAVWNARRGRDVVADA